MLAVAESERIGTRISGDAIGVTCIIMAAVTILLQLTGAWRF